ncbi:hypothetical protein [Arenibaculum pallidiluteum]|uniref:hypothetical protein n=1 Tax=Arenibaculum pallidiluteum TaxID=2812559 RepID=UPI001A95C68E|nr:hypothetical protein [Arenibaculum pallidiluteum]
MTTEKDRSQTEQDVSSPNQDPNHKVPADRPGEPPTARQPGSQGTQDSINTTSA